MDVRCSRCGTEYEFDDALISERGTTVKCTNCGYQFKVYPDAGAAAPERWVVRTAAGRELVYTSLKDLQRGIAKEHVAADDMLSRGNGPARPLSSIPELEPFLQSNAATLAGKHPPPRTLQGVAPAANSSRGGDGPPSLVLREDAPSAPTHERPLGTAPAIGQIIGASQAAALLPANLRAPTNPGGFASLPAASLRTPRGGVGLGSVPPEPASAPAPVPSLPMSDSVAPSTGARYLPEQNSGQNGAAAAPAAVAQRFAGPPAPAPDSGVGNSANGLDTAEPHARGLDEARALLQHDDQTDPYYVQSPTRRNARSRWLVLVVVLAAGVLLAGTVGKRYLAKYTKGREPVATQADARVTTQLAEGERLMLRGDLEGAKDAFANASALAANDRQVLTAIATLEVLRADLSWLQERLLDPNDAGARERTKRELATRVEGAGRAVERVARIAPDAPSTERLLVHAKRLAGKVSDARSHVATLSKDASLPENAYALAALDMADGAPVWSSIVHRMRIAAAAEGPVGLARAALVYALASSGDGEAALAELEQLAKANPSHPLLSNLREFLTRMPAGSATETSDTATNPAGSAATTTREAAGDFRAQLKQAYDAVESGELAKAERLYNAVLAKQPGNTEALSGLADVAQRRNDTSKASRLNAEVLKQNPSYLPALMASADLRWEAGDRHSAVQLYQRILKQAGRDSSYGQRSAQRIAQAESDAKADHDRNPVTEPESPEGRAPDAPAEAAPPAREPEAGDAPQHIDTTDLPELNQ
jgi:predicted Zn finger-like uncharacterized protein